MKNLIKLFALSLATLVLLAGCDKPNQVEKPKTDDSIVVGTWRGKSSQIYHDLIFKSDNKVIVGYSLNEPSFETCQYEKTFEGTYSFDETTNKITFVDNFRLVKEITAKQAGNGLANDKCLTKDVVVRIGEVIYLGGRPGNFTKTIDINVEKKELTGIKSINGVDVSDVVFKKQ